MAEKEERIFITTIERAEDIDEFCVYGRDCMTRSEAIERMAKEMARLYCPEKPTKKEFESIWEYELLLSTQKHFKELAEAALNALLEEK